MLTVIDAEKSIKAFIESNFDNLRVLLQWPEPKQKARYPYIALITSRRNRQRFQTEELKREVDDEGNTTFYYSIGEWEISFDLNYFSKNQKDMDNFIERFNNFFHSTSQNSIPTRTISIPFISDPTIKFSFTLLDFENIQPEGLQKGSRRVLYPMRANVPDVLKEVIPVIKTAELSDDSEISTTADTSEV